MTPNRAVSTLYLFSAFFLAKSDSFALVAGSTRLQRSAAFASPTHTMAFLRRGWNVMDETITTRTTQGQQYGHRDTSSAEADPPSYHGIDNKGEDNRSTNKNANDSAASQQSPTKAKGYQRAEDWDAEQKAGGMTWEQKVQFDGLRMGNGVRQNEILKKHLSSF